MGVHGYSLQIKNIEDDVSDGDSQLLLSLLASMFYHQEREPLIGAIVHPFLVSFCFVDLNFMTLFCTYGSTLSPKLSLRLSQYHKTHEWDWYMCCLTLALHWKSLGTIKTVRGSTGHPSLCFVATFYHMTVDITHVILDTRPSRFSACNIEKLGRAWVRGYEATRIWKQS